MKQRIANNSIVRDKIFRIFLRPIAKIRGFSKFPAPAIDFTYKYGDDPVDHYYIIEGQQTP
jgi:hypothetical protein